MMKHKLIWHPSAWEDYLYWLETDKKILKKINDLIKAIDRTPFEGIGKPEPLQYAFEGCWSRRINHEHRIIYEVENDEFFIAACRYHYE